MGGRAGGGASGGMGSRSRGGGFDFAREATAPGHPLFERFRKEAYEKTMASIDKNIKDPQLKAEMKAVVEKMHKEMGGLPHSGYEVKIESSKEFQKLGGSGFEFGRHNGSSIGLNARYYGKGYKSVEKLNKDQMAKGKMTTVNKPAMKTFAHEIGHGYYDGLSSGGKAQVAKVFSQFSSSKSTKGWGSYAKKSASEFYADAVAKSVLGGSDKWTKALGKIK
jgi:hypothetical protein